VGDGEGAEVDDGDLFGGGDGEEEIAAVGVGASVAEAGEGMKVRILLVAVSMTASWAGVVGGEDELGRRWRWRCAGLDEGRGSRRG